jgi:hypothetical protein
LVWMVAFRFWLLFNPWHGRVHSRWITCYICIFIVVQGTFVKSRLRSFCKIYFKSLFCCQFHWVCINIGSPMVCDLIWLIYIKQIVCFLNPEPWLDINHIKSWTMGDSFYHIFATLYLLFVRTIKSRSFDFVN